MKFFFDTADTTYIRNTYERLKYYIHPDEVLGVTTNPSALSKINCTTVKDVKSLIGDLTELLYNLRGDREGTIHIQIPNSDMTLGELNKFLERMVLATNSKIQMVIKVPPYRHILDFIQESRYTNIFRFNVTGIADVSTLFRCLLYPDVSYASIIPGRMEEVGLDATSHLSYSQHMGTSGRVIAGSMRTAKGLWTSVEYGCLPTIGSKLFDVLTEEDLGKFRTTLELRPKEQYPNNIPYCTEVNKNLTKSFFEQMNELGTPLYKACLTSQDSDWL